MVKGGESDIFLISAPGGQSRQLTRTPFNKEGPSFSRDGKWIYFGLNRNGDQQVWKMPVEGGESMQLTRKGGTFPQESMDGGTLFYLKPKEPGCSDDWLYELWKVPIEGGGESRVLGYVANSNFDVKQYGIYYASPPDPVATKFFFYEFAKTQAKIIATIQQGVTYGLTVFSGSTPYPIYSTGKQESKRPDAGGELPLKKAATVTGDVQQYSAFMG